MKFVKRRDSAVPGAIARTLSRGALTLLLLALSLAGCAVPVTRTTHIYDAPASVAYSGVEYGIVRGIDVVDTTEAPTGGGAVLGSLLGGVIGNEIGYGAGRAAATVLGAFGGAWWATPASRIRPPPARVITTASRCNLTATWCARSGTTI